MKAKAVRPVILSLLITLTLLTIQPVQPAQAATYICSEGGLDAAIAAGGGPHSFVPGPCTITVTSTKTITGTLILDGTGAGSSLTISGGGAVPIFNVTGSLTLNNLTLEQGYTTTNGGAIANNGGTVIIDNSTLQNNIADGDGGAIYNTGGGTVTIQNGTSLVNNTAANGGAISNDNGTVTVDASAVGQNIATSDGGGIYNNSTLNVLNTSVIGQNITSGDGGGIYTAGGTVTIDRGTIISNQGNAASSNGGGIALAGGTLTMQNGSMINSNSNVNNGGGIYMSGGSGSITNSTVTGNSATNTSGTNYHTSDASGTLTLTNVTIGMVTGGDSCSEFQTDGGGNTDLDGTCIGYPEIDVQRPAATSIPDGGTDAVGAQPLGTMTLTYTIDNTAGVDPLTVGGVTASNLTNVSNFTVVTGLPMTIAAGATSTLQIQFDIDAVGAFSFDLDIANNDSDENPYDIAVTGTGIAPEIDVQRPAGTGIADGGTDAQGAIPVGIQQTLTYTIENTGGDTLNVTSITSANPSNVTVDSITPSPATPNAVAASGTMTFDVLYTVTAAGAFSFDLDIASDDTDENPYDIAVTGTGTNNLAATAVCNGSSLDVTITAGDANFDINADDPAAATQTQANMPLGGPYTLASTGGYGTWTNITITELGGDTETANLADVTCIAPPSSGGGGGGGAASGCNIVIDVEADREIVAAGDPVMWTVLVTNGGSDECQGVYTYGTMPGEFSITAISPSRGSLTWDGGQYYLVELGTLAVNETVTVILDSLLQGGAAITLPEGVAAQSAGQSICLTGYITDPVNDTDCVTLFPDMLPATGGEPVAQNWGWLAAAGALIAGLGGYVVRRRMA